MLTIIFIAISQSLFSAVLILSKKNGTASDKLLSTWLILMSIELATCLFDLYYFDKVLLSSVFLLINPAFYLYIKSLTQADFKLSYLQLFHLIPYLVFEITVYLIQEPFSIHFLNPENPKLWFSISFSSINILSWAYYNVSSIVLVHKHRVNLKNEFSNIDPGAKIKWLLFILIFYVIYCFAVLISGLLALQIASLISFPHLYNFSMMLIIAYVLGFYGLKQTQMNLPKLSASFLEVSTKKYKSSVLSPEDKNRIKEKIIRFFENEKPYLDQSFDLATLSNKLDIPKHHLTEVLNTAIGMNFFSFVNKYRIQAVKEMLLNENIPYSIEAIGYDCGFNSKSSFFSVFKSMTGLTPKAFRSTTSKKK